MNEVYVNVKDNDELQDIIEDLKLIQKTETKDFYNIEEIIHNAYNVIWNLKHDLIEAKEELENEKTKETDRQWDYADGFKQGE